MGGVGSGSWYRFGKRTTTDECRSLDVRRFHREGLLKPGHWFSWCWWRAEEKVASIGIFVHRDRVIFSYRHRSGPGVEWEEVNEAVPLEWTPCNFGGERHWFVCPGVVKGVTCGRRVAGLYGRGKYFLCREWYDLR